MYMMWITEWTELAPITIVFIRLSTVNHPRHRTHTVTVIRRHQSYSDEVSYWTFWRMSRLFMSSYTRLQTFN